MLFDSPRIPIANSETRQGEPASCCPFRVVRCSTVPGTPCRRAQWICLWFRGVRCPCWPVVSKAPTNWGGLTICPLTPMRR